MFNVWCVWWICHVVNSQLRKWASESTAKWWLAGWKTRSICAALHKGWRSRVKEGVTPCFTSDTVLRLSQHLRHSLNYGPLLFPPFSEATVVERGAKSKMHEGEVSSSVQFPNYQPERLLGLMCYRRQIIFQMGKVHSLQMDGGGEHPSHVAVKSIMLHNFKAGGLGLIVLYILTFWPVN